MKSAKVSEMRMRDARPNFLVNVGWWCTLPTLLVLVSASPAHRGGAVAFVGFVWACGLAAFVRLRAMGVVRDGGQLMMRGLFGTTVLDTGVRIVVRRDRVGKERLLVVAVATGALGWLLASATAMVLAALVAKG